MYLLVISLALVALTGLTACIPGGGGMMGGQGGTMGSGGQMDSGDMMGGQESGMMGPGMMGPGMMGGWGANNPNAEQITIDDAAEAVERYLGTYGQDLALAEVMEFAWNFYAEVEEESTGIHAMELLIDKYTGQVYPEMGPNMMWNSKYGMMGQSQTAEMAVTSDQALKVAQDFLDANLPGVTVSEADTFYGYYTLHTLRDGKIEGMLSVNGYEGGVWYHDWHGSFIGMEEFHGESEGGHSH
jgi:hypothetical protein